MTTLLAKPCSVCKELSCINVLCEMDIDLTAKVDSKTDIPVQGKSSLLDWSYFKVILADFYQSYLQNDLHDLRRRGKLTRGDDVLEASIKGFCHVVYRLTKRFSQSQVERKLDPELKVKMEEQIRADTLWLEREWGVTATEYLAPRIALYHTISPLLQNEIQHRCVWGRLVNSQALKQHFAQLASDSTSREVVLGRQMLQLGLRAFSV